MLKRAHRVSIEKSYRLYIRNVGTHRSSMVYLREYLCVKLFTFPLRHAASFGKTFVSRYGNCIFDCCAFTDLAVAKTWFTICIHTLKFIYIYTSCEWMVCVNPHFHHPLQLLYIRRFWRHTRTQIHRLIKQTQRMVQTSRLYYTEPSNRDSQPTTMHAYNPNPLMIAHNHWTRSLCRFAWYLSFFFFCLFGYPPMFSFVLCMCVCVFVFEWVQWERRTWQH